MDQRTNLDVVDYEREENLPPSALVSYGMGLLVAVTTVLFTGIGAMVAIASDESGWIGGLAGAAIGAVLAILFVLIESHHLANEGR